ncbi:MAG TPA: hypothetical protein VH206_06085 [Xanthobacteraceae bacterium]|nr:hypothetical protein [Xanthobacteraceae bacterium]
MAAIAVCLAVSACSPGADYPTLFPAVHDMPPPRAEAPLNPVQVQQTTEDLISERDRLNGGTQGSGKTQPARLQPVSQTSAGNGAGATTAGGQAVGTETK